jgi:hypothetical protein
MVGWFGGEVGPQFDDPRPAGSFVIHHANQIHYDGAKDEEVIVQITGVGTNATTLVDESGKPK